MLFFFNEFRRSFMIELQIEVVDLHLLQWEVLKMQRRQFGCLMDL